MKKRNSKKGNVAAITLVIVLLLVAITVMVYRPFIPEESRLDYGEVFSEVKSGVERGYFESFRTSMRTGFSVMPGGVFYWNQPYNVPLEIVEERMLELMEDTIINVEYTGGSESIRLGDIEGSYDLKIEEEGVIIRLEDAYIDIVSDTETRRVDLSDRYVIPSELKYMHEKLNTWLECDAGGLTDLFLEYHESEVCQFSNCCCGREPITMAEIGRIVDRHGIKMGNVTTILDSAVEVLNNLMSGATVCGETVDLREDLRCFVSYDRSVIEIGNDYNLLVKEDKVCADSPGSDPETDDCSLHPSPYDGRILTDWATPQTIDFVGMADIEFQPISLSRLPTDPITEELNQDVPDPDNDPRALYELGLERKAAGDITIMCRNPDLSASDYQELRFRIKFKNRYVCDPPDDEPDWETTDQIPLVCAGGGGGGPAVCPDDTPDAVPCAPDDRLHHRYCPVDIICVVADLGQFNEQGLFECAEYIDLGLPWHYPGADDRCEGDFTVCSLCGDQAMCDVPAAGDTGCSTPEYPSGRINQCIDLRCTGVDVGVDACVVQVPNDRRCGSGSCMGTCDPNTGACIYHTNGDACIQRIGACSVTGTCNNGRCSYSSPGTDCCDGSWCPSSRPYCCGDSYCSSDPTCPRPS